VPELRRHQIALSILGPFDIASTPTIDNSLEITNANINRLKIDNTCEVLDLLDSDSDDKVLEVKSSKVGANSSKRSVAHIQCIDLCSSSNKNLDTELMPSFHKHLVNAGNISNKSKESKQTGNKVTKLDVNVFKQIWKVIQTMMMKLITNKRNVLDNTDGGWTFKVATWNIWLGYYRGGRDRYGYNRDGEPHPGPRMTEIVRLLMEQSTADVPLLFIGLQEVTDPLAHYLIPALELAGYRVFRQNTFAFGCAVAVHEQLEIVSQSWIPYTKTVTKRGYYQVRAKLPNKHKPYHCPEILFTTTHLETYNSKTYTGAKERLSNCWKLNNFAMAKFLQLRTQLLQLFLLET
jgi:hypothetical protein